MSAQRTSESDNGKSEMRAALAAGWRRTDLVWERLQIRGNAAWINGDHTGARRNFLIAWMLARIFFKRGDPRIATSIANVGLMAREAGQFARAARHYARAQHLWTDVPHVLDGLRIRPRVRSSLFHLRMEVRHRGTYEKYMRARIANFVALRQAKPSMLPQGATPRLIASIPVGAVNVLQSTTIPGSCSEQPS